MKIKKNVFVGSCVALILGSSFPANSQTQYDSVSVLVADGLVSKYGTQFISDKINNGIDFNNKIFNRYGVDSKKYLKSLKLVNSKNRGNGNLLWEVNALVAGLYDYQQMDVPSVSAGGYFKDTDALKTAIKWINAEHGKYKLILLPYSDSSLDCAQTYTDESYDFTVAYYSLFGECSGNWILSHEFLHSDGFPHSQGGLMSEGVQQADRTKLNTSEVNKLKAIYLKRDNGETDINPMGPESSYSVTNAEIEVIDAKKAVVSGLISNNSSNWLNGNAFAFLPIQRNLNANPIKVDLGSVSVPPNRELLIKREIKASPSVLLLTKGSALISIDI
ncbi:hypothetical protein [Photobacterium kishitanii]|uniref:Uncharacterized protein n=1 Tax=Photobacterium kishitanii TaxID=318456 RepID=A0A2T3KME2_9GAMM|nr:hypothetical protein [Photobacterium kishitanii]PSV00970.1 hypothetical protein C9J27_02795 [Photobacterium kishitanii]